MISSSFQADLLDVVGMVYVGGLPQNYTTKRIGPVRKHTHTQSNTFFRVKSSCISVYGSLFPFGCSVKLQQSAESSLLMSSVFSLLGLFPECVTYRNLIFFACINLSFKIICDHTLPSSLFLDSLQYQWMHP